jgi:periplasmic divalent cation tolerance protein
MSTDSRSPAPDDLMVVLTTLPNAEVAERLVHTLVEERLVACGNLVPGLISVYRWQGEIAREAETLALLKTSRDRLGPLFERAAELHPYEVPELVALSADEVSRAYGQWILQEVKA